MLVKKNFKKNISKKKEKKSKEILLQNPRGMRDILPEEQNYWDQIRKVLEQSYRDYGFGRMDLPILEYSDLLIRSIGEGTDIVDKEMYSFVTKGGDKLSLRPEFTAGLARAYLQHGMNVRHKPVKIFSMGAVYRYDRPQEGRYRELYQANFDIFGEQDAVMDAHIIQLASRILAALDIKKVQFQINSIGCPVCRKNYLNLLKKYFESKKNKLCQTCRKRIHTNPLRILDCKEDKCSQVAAQAPQILDHLCDDCRLHFRSLLEYLEELEIFYVINPRLVRGLSYYTKTVFEIWPIGEEGKKYSLGGGGRYDNLVELLGGEKTPAIGFALGLDRVVAEMKKIKAKAYVFPIPKVFLAQLGDLAKKKSLKLFSDLEKNGVLVAESFGRGSLKSQLRIANRLKAEITIIMGQKEALDGTVIMKNMATGTQETLVVNEKLPFIIKKALKNNGKVIKK